MTTVGKEKKGHFGAVFPDFKRAFAIATMKTNKRFKIRWVTYWVLNNLSRLRQS